MSDTFEYLTDYIEHYVTNKVSLDTQIVVRYKTDQEISLHPETRMRIDAVVGAAAEQIHNILLQKVLGTTR